MNKNSEILREISEISPLLAELQGVNVFSVPEGYFAELSTRITSEIAINKIIETSNKEQPHNVPVGYFESLSSTILNRIKRKGSTEQSESGILDRIGKENVFTVPEGYFENLPSRILGRVKESRTAKVVKFNRSNSVLKYAVAAVLGLAILSTAYFVTNSMVHNNNSFAVITKKTVPNEAALKYNTQKKFDKGIESLSDEQIISYLENHGNILDNDLIISGMDDSGMPEALDYLIDENTLDNYLRKLNAVLN